MLQADADADADADARKSAVRVDRAGSTRRRPRRTRDAHRSPSAAMPAAVEVPGRHGTSDEAQQRHVALQCIVSNRIAQNFDML
ncbi:hypothetical protein [Chitinasiproducens palmae]|uniref:hypothetical protein n=1 Tax=Chitinasiproducens palmae TaxID=1770053 RepID=UPI000B81BFDF|nr:hypothetical protein [Chitinasiproducens palmae]